MMVMATTMMMMKCGKPAVSETRVHLFWTASLFPQPRALKHRSYHHYCQHNRQGCLHHKHQTDPRALVSGCGPPWQACASETFKWVAAPARDED